MPVITDLSVIRQSPHCFPRTDVGIFDALHIDFGFVGLPKAAPALPGLRSGWPRLAWPKTAAFSCFAFDTGGVGGPGNPRLRRGNSQNLPAPGVA